MGHLQSPSCIRFNSAHRTAGSGDLGLAQRLYRKTAWKSSFHTKYQDCTHTSARFLVEAEAFRVWRDAAEPRAPPMEFGSHLGPASYMGDTPHTSTMNPCPASARQADPRPHSTTFAHVMQGSAIRAWSNRHWIRGVSGGILSQSKEPPRAPSGKLKVLALAKKLAPATR
jgi:hypothetical protein